MSSFRVLFITSSRLGDAILSTALLRYLEEKHRNLSLTVVCGALPSDLFQAIPFCERVIITHKKSFARHWIDVWKQVKGSYFDLVIDLRGTFLSYALNTKKRVRWSSKLLQNHPSPQTLHQVERLKFLWAYTHQSIKRLVTDDLKLMTPKLWLHEERLAKAQTYITAPTLALAPTANWIGKEWPIQNFREIIHRFFNTFPEHHILLLAAPFEGKALQTITEELRSDEKSRISTMLSPDLNEVAATLKQCDMFLGNDSGLMHMAAALDIPTIGLFGPSDNRRYAPFGDHHLILRTPKNLRQIETTPGFSYQAKQSFMTDLSIDTVWNTVCNQWERMHVKIDHLAHIPLWGKS